MNKYMIGVIFMIAILVIGYFVIINIPSETNEKLAIPTLSSQTPTLTKNDINDLGVSTSGAYESYGAEKLTRAEDGKVVLFFHASWCPTCRGLNQDIESNLNSIPVGITILKTDYDKETELKKKYGVTTQHTLVQVDQNGNLIKKWTGGSKLTNLLSQIN